MPPGSKKRKAAKKKQEQEASSTQINLKSNNNNHDSPKKSNEEQDAIRIEKDTGERIEITDSSHDHDKSSSNSSSSSSSSSSDDESPKVKKKADETKETSSDSVSVPDQPLPIAGDAPFMGSTANAIVENTGLIDSVATSDLNSEEQHIEISPVVETIIENEADENFLSKPIDITTAEASSGVTDSDVKENEEKTSSPLPESNDVPEVVISHNEEEVTVRPTHGVAQRTSWLSCCGLFDVVSGSSR